jgi:hypothetical protein
MSDTNAASAPPASVAPDTATGVSHDTFNETKRLAEDRGAENANLKAKLELYERRDRDQLRSFQPAMEEMMKELHDEAPADARSHFVSMLDWTRTASDRPNIDTQMQLGTVVHACASKLKRVRDDAHVSSATADQLAASAKENESLKADNVGKERRIDELSTSLKEITANHEKLQMQLEKAGMLKSSEKFDFSKASAREVDAPAGVDVKTENASKGAIGVISDFNPSHITARIITLASCRARATIPSLAPTTRTPASALPSGQCKPRAGDCMMDGRGILSGVNTQNSVAAMAVGKVGCHLYAGCGVSTLHVRRTLGRSTGVDEL